VQFFQIRSRFYIVFYASNPGLPDLLIYQISADFEGPNLMKFISADLSDSADFQPLNLFCLISSNLS
jgi:hypothetical protein